MKFEAEIEKSFKCDVLVVGGGVAGFAAAVAAARGGADVILCEENGYLGGCATAGLVAPFMTCYDTKGENRLIHGIFAELVDRLAASGGAISPADCRKCDSYSGYRLRGHLGTTPFDKERLKIELEDMCIEAGVTLKYHYMFVGVERKARRMTAAVFATDGGLRRVTAKEFVDCTGDASVCARAGCRTMLSDETGELQPVSTFFLIDNVDKAALDAACLNSRKPEERAFMDLVKKAKERGEFPCGTEKVRVFEQPGGIWAVNMCQIDRRLDVLDPDELTAAEIEGRKQAQAIVGFLKKYVPGMANIRLLQTSERVGVRESRRIAGEYVLTYEDILAAREFDDAIVFAANSMDVHTSGAVDYRPTENERPYSVPYRCIVAADLDNAWAPGKSVSADRRAHGAIRVIPPAMAMGEAAGIAAAIAAKEGLRAKDVPAARIREKISRR